MPVLASKKGTWGGVLEEKLCLLDLLEDSGWGNLCDVFRGKNRIVSELREWVGRKLLHMNTGKKGERFRRQLWHPAKEEGALPTEGKKFPRWVKGRCTVELAELKQGDSWENVVVGKKGKV